MFLNRSYRVVSLCLFILCCSFYLTAQDWLAENQRNDREEIEISFHITTASGTTPLDSARIYVINTDQNYSHWYELIGDDTISITSGTYNIYVGLSGYYPHSSNPVELTEDTTIHISMGIRIGMACPPPQPLPPAGNVINWAPPPPGSHAIFKESFDNGVIPDNWTQLYSSITDSIWMINAGSYSGFPGVSLSGGFNVSIGGNNNVDTVLLVTPLINLSGINSPRLVFWYSLASDNIQDELKVFYKESDSGQWYLLKSYSKNTPYWSLSLSDLPVNSDECYIGFSAKIFQDGYGICLDDIEVTSDFYGLLEGYNVYLDGEFIAFTPYTSVTLNDLVIGNLYILGVNAQYEHCSSICIEFPFVYYTCDYFLQPSNFEGSFEGMDLLLTWDPPCPPNLIEFRYDDGNYVANIGFIMYSNPVLGASFSNAANIYIIDWFYYPSLYPMDSVNLCLFNLDSLGTPANLLYISDEIAVNPQWNTHLLNVPVECPNGFLVGLTSSSPHTFLSADDGSEPPWEFIPNTQWFTFDYIEGYWETLEDNGYYHSFLIRAYGEDLGEIDIMKDKNQRIDSIFHKDPQIIYLPLERSVSAVEFERNFELIGYNLWCNNLQINNEPLPPEIHEYTEVISPGGIYNYSVTAVYNQGESCLFDPGFEVISGANLPTPHNLTAQLFEGHDILLSWDLPDDFYTEYLQWDDGTYSENLGFTNGGTWYVAARFDTDDLSSYHETSLKAISFIPGINSGSTQFQVYIWTGENGSNQVFAKEIQNPVPGEWNEILIDTPIIIDSTQELWLGYCCFDQAPGEYPAGMDAGPHVPDKGDMLSFTGSSWTTLFDASGGAVDCNWNIKGKVILNEQDNLDELGYNIWKDNMQLTFVDFPDTSFIDPDVLPGLYEYQVSAVYEEGESFPDGPAQINMPSTGCLRGCVRDSLTHQPLENITVSLFPGSATCTTLENGQFIFNYAEIGNYWIKCSDSSGIYQTISYSDIDVTYNDTTFINFKLFPTIIKTLPFEEDWSDFSFDHNFWTFEPAPGNWIISVKGNPSPSAEFSWTPVLNNYAFSLESPNIAIDFSTENLMLLFDLNLSCYTANGLEMMKIKLWDGVNWSLIDELSNTQNIIWETLSYDISDACSTTDQIKIKFEAIGDNSYYLNHWRIDNIMVLDSTITNLPLNPINPGIKIFPNPATHILKISSSEPLNSIKIFNYAGQEIYHNMLISDINLSINISNYESGLYIIHCNTSDNKTVSKKFIIP